MEFVDLKLQLIRSCAGLVNPSTVVIPFTSIGRILLTAKDLRLEILY